MRFAVLFLFFALARAVTLPPWTSISLPSGDWVALQEVIPRQRFWLHPQAVIIRANLSRGCRGQSPATIVVRLWRPQDLPAAERELHRLRLCRSKLQCRVEPFQARSVSVRDQLGTWRPLRPRRFVPVILAPIVRFELIRNRSAPCVIPDVRQLNGLDIEVGGAGRQGKQVIRMSVDTSRVRVSNGLWSNATSVREEMQEEIDRLQKKLDASKAESNDKVKPLCASKTLPTLKETESGLLIIKDCLDVKLRGLEEGMYFLQPFNKTVLCTASGEVVVLRRTKHDLSFNKLWADYRRGFGDQSVGDFFSGMKFMSSYTAGGDKCMRMVLGALDKKLPAREAQYSNFKIDSEANRFRLNYNKFSGTLQADPMTLHRGKNFYTPDRNDRNKCASRYKAGNWFSNCNYFNLFGRYKWQKPHDGFFSKGLDKNSKNKYVSLSSAYMTLRSVGGRPEALKMVFVKKIPSCPAKVAYWNVPETGEYLITVGGAAGGKSPHYNSASGGKGAIVRTRVFLKKGSKLRFVVGCAGKVGYVSGFGGDGTFVGDYKSKTLIAAAGGGGGAGWTSGGNGRAEAEGGAAKMTPDAEEDALSTPASGYEKVMKRKLFSSIGYTATSGGLTWMGNKGTSRGGGGGGGFTGGWTADDAFISGDRDNPKYSAGGGGGSSCGPNVESCEMIEGGNSQAQGFLSIGAYRCF